LIKKLSPYRSILWDMDSKSTPALNSTKGRHVQAVAVPAAAAVDGLKVGGNKKATPGGVAFFNGRFVDRDKASQNEIYLYRVNGGYGSRRAIPPNYLQHPNPGKQKNGFHYLFIGYGSVKKI
jgi:hypothetical protein